MDRRRSETHRRHEHQQRICLPLPSDVVSVVGNGERCENIGLWIDKFLPINRQSWEVTAEAKKRNPVFKLARDSKIREIVNALKERHEALLNWYKAQGFKACQFEAKPVWRFVVGLGATHVLETSITLHRIFGLPIIPASGLKGVTRAYALFELAKELGVPILSPAEAKKKKTPIQKLEEIVTFFSKESSEEKRQKKLDEFLKDELLPQNAQIRRLELETLWQKLKPFVDTFGTTTQAGKIVFLDAIPLTLPKFELDIMNPHFSDYYRGSGKIPPSDWQSPIPVTFLTVSKTLYHFAIVAHRDSAVSLEKVEKWLKCALKELGIGAKTSADYGYWEL